MQFTRPVDGEHARWRWSSAPRSRAVAVWSADELHRVRYELDGVALRVDVVPGWNRIAEVPAQQPVELTLTTDGDGTFADAAALVALEMPMSALTELTI